MKPGHRPYDRNSKEWQTMETSNPCNEFIVQFLVRSKIKIDKQGLNQYYCYNLAIQSVKKYPLPILCQSQLAVIEGFGDFFKTETMKLIKQHYQRGRLPTPEEKKQDVLEQNQSLRLNIKKINSRKSEKRINKKTFKSDSDDIEEYQNAEVPEDINVFESQGDSRFEGSNFSKISSKSSKMLSTFSQNSQASSQSSSRAYRPKVGTQPYLILETMKNLDAHKKPITKGEINQYLYDKSQQKLKLWHLTRSKLRQHGYIKIDDDDNDFLHLTQKGLIYLEGCPVPDESQCKIKKQEQTSQNETKGIKKIPLPPPVNYKELTIIINDNIPQEDKKIINSRLGSIRNLKFRFQKLEFGDFLWEIEDNLMDIVIMRINLAQFQENQFKNICYRLKATETKDCILFLELSQEDRTKKTPEDLSKIQDFIVKAKITKIKIYRTTSLKQTIFGIQKFRKILLQTLKNIVNGTQIMNLGSLQDYNERSERKDPYILRNLFISSLRQFPCISIKTIQGIVERLPSFKLMYDKMSQLKDDNQRVEFLNWMLQNHQLHKGINRMIVDFMFSKDYTHEM